MDEQAPPIGVELQHVDGDAFQVSLLDSLKNKETFCFNYISVSQTGEEKPRVQQSTPSVVMRHRQTTSVRVDQTFQTMFSHLLDTPAPTLLRLAVVMHGSFPHND